MRTVLAVAALLVTAGCLGALGVDDAEPTPADGFPPGVTADGVENATELLDANAAALTDSGHEFRVTTSAATGNATYTGRALGDEFRMHEQRQNGGGTATVDTWANDSVVLTRAAVGNETRFDQRERHSGAATPWRAQLERLLAAGDFAVTDRYVAEGGTRLELAANRTRPAHDDAYRAFSARAVVDLDGVVHELDAETTVDAQFDSRTRSVDYELTDVGVDAVERPDWAGRAQATVTASVSLDSTREYVVLEHEAGDPLREGTTVELTHDGEMHTLTFDRSLDVGERAYVAYPADGGPPVLAYEEPAGEFERIQGSYEVRVTGPDGASILNAGFAVESATAEAPDA